MNLILWICVLFFMIPAFSTNQFPCDSLVQLNTKLKNKNHALKQFIDKVNASEVEKVDKIMERLATAYKKTVQALPRMKTKEEFEAAYMLMREMTEINTDEKLKKYENKIHNLYQQLKLDSRRPDETIVNEFANSKYGADEYAKLNQEQKNLVTSLVNKESICVPNLWDIGFGAAFVGGSVGVNKTKCLGVDGRARYYASGIGSVNFFHMGLWSSYETAPTEKQRTDDIVRVGVRPNTSVADIVAVVNVIDNVTYRDASPKKPAVGLQLLATLGNTAKMSTSDYHYADVLVFSKESKDNYALCNAFIPSAQAALLSEVKPSSKSDILKQFEERDGIIEQMVLARKCETQVAGQVDKKGHRFPPKDSEPEENQSSDSDTSSQKSGTAH